MFNIILQKQYQDKILDSWNTHDKKFRTHEYPREKISDPRNAHEQKF